MSAPLSAEQRAAIESLLGDAQPAADSLLLSFAEQIRDRREHDHDSGPDWDWFCLNSSGWLGDKAPTVLRRLLDAEAQAERWQTTAASWRKRYYTEAGTRWDDELPPGGEVCATCEQPVESEPCAEHNPRVLAERLRTERDEFADRVDTLTAVAKGNKRHVQMLFGDLQAAQARITALEADAARLQAVADREHKAFIDTHNALNLLREDVNRVMAEHGVQAQQAELERVREQAAKFKQQRGERTKFLATVSAELERTKARVTELEQQLSAPRELFLAEYETDEPRLYLTLNAARDALTTARNTGDPLVPWAWQEQDGVWAQWRTDPDQDDRPVELLLGSIMRVALPAGLLAGEPPREAAQPADDGGRCGRCRRPFDPADTRWDGYAEYHDSGYCRSCIDNCHDTEIADHRCPICARPGERS
jgi:hypothetical protein